MLIYENDSLLFDTSSLKLNLAINKLPSFKFSSEKLVKSESVNFNDSFVYRPNTYSGERIELEFLVRNSKFDSVVALFHKGNRLVFDEDNLFYREYYVDGATECKYFGEYISVKLPIYLNAFRYFISRDSFIANDNTTRIFKNKGNVYAEPVYTIYGNGEVIFSINGVRNILKNCDNFYSIVCENKKQNVFDSNGNLKNISSEYGGEFSLLDVGDNRIQLIKGTKLEVSVNWRCK